MDFDFINELSKLIANNNIFKFTFTGAKVLAFAILIFKVLETFTNNIGEKEIKIGSLASILGYGCVIMSSDWIITSIENVFAQVDVAMNNTSSILYLDLNRIVIVKLEAIFKNIKDPFDFIAVLFESFLIIVSLIIAWIIGGLCKLADMSITASYLIQRLFILKLLKILFPLALALSTYSGTQKLFHTWILRYIGVFVLGIAYIGIIGLTTQIQIALSQQFGSDYMIADGTSFAVGILVTMIVTFTVKVKLFSMVTNYVMGMFQ